MPAHLKGQNDTMFSSHSISMINGVFDLALILYDVITAGVSDTKICIINCLTLMKKD